jgi:small-conductance mechanosensitive channel
MNQKTFLYWMTSLLLLAIYLTSFTVIAVPGSESLSLADLPGRLEKGAEVSPFGTPIFTIQAPIGPFSAAQRAKLNEQKIRSLAKDPFFRTDSIKLFKSELAYTVMYGESIITSIFDEDAKAEGSTREIVARQREAKIILSIQEHRKATNFGEILKNVGLSLGILIIFIILITLTVKLFRRIASRLEEWQEKIMRLLHIKEYAFFDRKRQLVVLQVLLTVLRWILILLLLVVTLLTIFYLLPWTKPISIAILNSVLNPLKNILQKFWEYIPNLIAIIVILVVSRLIIKFFKFLKREVENETLKIPGFYADWALPTYNIFRVLIIIFTIVAIWPYLPGSGSQVFQGVSVFFGLVFSLTSASSLSNFMAGLTITYTRAFKLGDRVKIGEITGDIIEKSMLVTKIRTIKNEEITVPNNKIMNSEVINYSTCAPDLGLIMHTTVTIGYDAPWRQVHHLLIDAALKTDMILAKPAPFVLQTALNDFYISYQINAYTRAPNDMAVIFSNLHANIQDSFNRAGVEIMSPHYKSIRDGNTIAIPEENRPDNYEAPSFRVENKSGSENRK